MRRTRPTGWIVSTAAVSAVGLSLLAAPVATLAQSARPATSSSGGFSKTVQHLLDQARKDAAVGQLDTAIQTAFRAKKIAEASATAKGTPSDEACLVADQLYRELLTQRSRSIHPEPSRSTVSLESIVSAEPVTTALASKDDAADPATPVQADMKVVSSDAAPLKPVVLKRGRITLSSVAPQTASAETSAPLWKGPDSQPAANPAPVVEARPTMASPNQGKPTEWTSAGAVVPRQRLARGESLRSDGWHSPGENPSAVTRAGGSVSDLQEASETAVAPVAYHNGLDSERNAASELESLMPSKTEGRAAPPPPFELEELDVAMQSPSVWVRDTTPILAPETTAAAPPATAWQSFSKWTKHRGWSGSSAAAGIAAAILAVLACALALVPRRSGR